VIRGQLISLFAHLPPHSRGPKLLHRWSVRPPSRTLHLQVLQRNERQSSPHGDAEGELRHHPRDPLTIHLLSPLKVRGQNLTLLW
jgi:hypothetical protein